MAVRTTTAAMLHSIDECGRLAEVSAGWLAVLGYVRDEVIGRPSTDFLSDASARYAREEVLPRFFATGACEVDYDMRRRDGSLLPVRLRGVAVRDARGAFERSIAQIEVRPAIRPGSVLVVDDDELVRVTLGALLEHEGYAVALAATGAEAMACAAADAPQACLVDLTLRGESGPALAARLAAAHPAVRIVLMSGHRGASAAAATLGGARFLRKPFTEAELLHAIGHDAAMVPAG